MSKLLIYYSFTGTTKRYAQKVEKEENIDILELKEKKKRSTIGAYIFGCYGAITGKKSEIEPVNIDFSKYEEIILASPVWASLQVPAINTVIGLLPENMKVRVILISQSGESESSRITKILNDKKCEVIEIKNIKKTEI